MTTVVLAEPRLNYGVTSWQLVEPNGVAWICEKLDGWADMPESDAPALQRSFDHGAWSGEGYFAARALTLVGVIDAPDRFALQAALHRLRGTHATALRDSVELTVNEVDGEKRLVVRAAQLGFGVDYFNDHAVRVTAELFAPWPVKQSFDREQTSFGATRGEGWRYPRSGATRRYATAGYSGDLVLINEGNAPTRPRFTIFGPCNRPALIAATAGRRLAFNIGLGDEDRLIVDAVTHSVLLNEVANRRYVLTPDSAWFDILPGQNVVQYRPESGAGGVTATYAAGWW